MWIHVVAQEKGAESERAEDFRKAHHQQEKWKKRLPNWRNLSCS